MCVFMSMVAVWCSGFHLYYEKSSKMSMVAVWCSGFHLYYEKSSKIMNFFLNYELFC